MSAGSTPAPTTEARRVALALSVEERELAVVVRQFLASAVGPVTADAASWSVLDPDGALWRRFAEEVGLQGLAVPEELDGQGFGLREQAIVAEELGAALCPAPMLGTVGMASRVLLACPPSPARDDALRAIASGVRVAALAPDTVASVVAGRLSGTTRAVVDGDVADLLVVAVHTDGAGLRLVEVGAPGVTRTVRESLDLSRGTATFVFDAAGSESLAEGDLARHALARGLAEAQVLLAAESVGNARASLAAAVDYAKIREQFGRAIGSFQALKHRMADVLVSVESAAAAVRYAAGLADATEGGGALPSLRLAAGVALGSACRAASFASAENIQIHGGIGFTWEHPAHLRFRRATSAQVLLGTPHAAHDQALALLAAERHAREGGA